MFKSDELVIGILSFTILIQTAILIAGRITGKPALPVSIFNAAFAFSVLGYWLVRQFQIQQHMYDSREALVLFSEIILIILTVYSIIIQHSNYPLRVIQYCFFAIHFLVCLLAFIFMLTFKINRLL
jgi:hypothetical protein